jgi:prepilin-type N-terminal cleavage/methylation domain-containing protein
MHRAFTLIELLVSITIGVMLIGMAWSALAQGRALIQRTTVRIELHQQASTIRANLAQETGDLHPGCAIRYRAGVDAATGLLQVDLTWMTSLLNDERYGFTPDSYAGNRSGLVWNRWRWEGSSAGGLGRLMHAASTDMRTVRLWYKVLSASADEKFTFANFPAPRRSASRSLDDNDFSQLDNYAASGMKGPDGLSRMAGDGRDLEAHLVPVHTRVRDFQLSFVGADGTVLRTLGSADCATGISGGYDGCWLDARDAGLATSPVALRPQLLRVSFTLVDPRAPAVLADANDPSIVVQTFGFSLPLAAVGPHP